MGNFILGIIIGGAFLFYYHVNDGSDNSTENTNTNIEDTNTNTEVDLEWVNPTEDVCTSNGGELENGICRANWESANYMCEVSGARLPTIDELRAVIDSCGGTFVEGDDKNGESIVDKNIANSSYQSCYKDKGFSNRYYWSSTSSSGSIDVAWIVGFYHGIVGEAPNLSYHIRCVR